MIVAAALIVGFIAGAATVTLIGFFAERAEFQPAERA